MISSKRHQNAIGKSGEGPACNKEPTLHTVEHGRDLGNSVDCRTRANTNECRSDTKACPGDGGAPVAHLRPKESVDHTALTASSLPVDESSEEETDAVVECLKNDVNEPLGAPSQRHDETADESSKVGNDTNVESVSRQPQSETSAYGLDARCDRPYVLANAYKEDDACGSIVSRESTVPDESVAGSSSNPSSISKDNLPPEKPLADSTQNDILPESDAELSSCPPSASVCDDSNEADLEPVEAPSQHEALVEDVVETATNVPHDVSPQQSTPSSEPLMDARHIEETENEPRVELPPQSSVEETQDEPQLELPPQMSVRETQDEPRVELPSQMSVEETQGDPQVEVPPSMSEHTLESISSPASEISENEDKTITASDNTASSPGDHEPEELSVDSERNEHQSEPSIPPLSSSPTKTVSPQTKDISDAAADLHEDVSALLPTNQVSGQDNESISSVSFTQKEDQSEVGESNRQVISSPSNKRAAISETKAVIDLASVGNHLSAVSDQNERDEKQKLQNFHKKFDPQENAPLKQNSRPRSDAKEQNEKIDRMVAAAEMVTGTTSPDQKRSVRAGRTIEDDGKLPAVGAFHMGNGTTSPPTEERDSAEAKKLLAFSPPPRSLQSQQNIERVQYLSPIRRSPQWVPADEESAKNRWARRRQVRGDLNRSQHRGSAVSGQRHSVSSNRASISKSCQGVSKFDEESSLLTSTPFDMDDIHVDSRDLSESPMSHASKKSLSPLEVDVPTLEASLVDVFEAAPIQATNVDEEKRKRKRWYAVAVVTFCVLVVALATMLALVVNSSTNEDSISKNYICEKPGLTQMTPGMYQGVTVNYLSFATEISSPSFPVRAKEFEACTGATITFSEAANVWEDPITDLGRKASRGAEIFDGYLMSNSHFPEASHLGLLEHLNDRIRNSNEQIQWQDMLPKVRSMGEFRKNGTTFVDFLMYDGDFFVPIVRLDLLEEHNIPLPNTWEELVDVASYFNGTDLNEDGVPDYGFCHFPRRGAGYWDWWFAESVYGTWASVEQTEGTEQGFLFDDETFEPRIGAGFRFAAGIWKDLWKNGANCENTNFVEGRCAVGLGPPGCWKQVFQKGVKRVDDNGSLLWQPTMVSGEYAEPYRFLPFGSTHVVDRATGEMVPCTSKLCPTAEMIPKRGHHGDNDRARVLPASPLEGQLINRVPYYWSGGLGTAIRKSADPIKKDLLWDFFTYTNSPDTSVKDLVDYPSWLDAWRYSQLSPGDNFLAANWSETAFTEHYDIMHWALSSESNGAYNLRLPGAAEYTRDVVGDAMLDFIEGRIENEDVLAEEVVTGWEKITRDRGKLDQLQIYRASLNLEQLPAQ